MRYIICLFITVPVGFPVYHTNFVTMVAGKLGWNACATRKAMKSCARNLCRLLKNKGKLVNFEEAFHGHFPTY